MGSPQESLQEVETTFRKNEDNGVLEGAKSPRRIVHFASGETMEEYSTEEEEDEQKQQQPVDTSTLSWGPYLQFWAVRIATTSFLTCEFLGGKLAALFGLDEPKYRYAVEEYYRTQREEHRDGETSKRSDVDSLGEKSHFEVEGVEYGSVKDTVDFAQSPLANVGEVSEHDL